MGNETSVNDFRNVQDARSTLPNPLPKGVTAKMVDAFLVYKETGYISTVLLRDKLEGELEQTPEEIAKGMKHHKAHLMDLEEKAEAMMMSNKDYTLEDFVKIKKGKINGIDNWVPKTDTRNVINDRQFVKTLNDAFMGGVDSLKLDGHPLVKARRQLEYCLENPDEPGSKETIAKLSCVRNAKGEKLVDFRKEEFQEFKTSSEEKEAMRRRRIAIEEKKTQYNTRAHAKKVLDAKASSSSASHPMLSRSQSTSTKPPTPPPPQRKEVHPMLSRSSLSSSSKPPPSPSSAPQKAQHPMLSKSSQPASTKPPPPPPSAATISDGAHRRKDGLLDMRYSENKGHHTPTPSHSFAGGGGMGYSGGATTFSDGLHRCKDGSLNMRYAENKGKDKYAEQQLREQQLQQQREREQRQLQQQREQQLQQQRGREQRQLQQQREQQLQQQREREQRLLQQQREQQMRSYHAPSPSFSYAGGGGIGYSGGAATFSGGGRRCHDGSLDMRCSENKGRDKWG